jgi:Arylsulfatase A and related enzymes
MVLGSLTLPQAVWSRLLVLFVALTGAKLALIVSLGKRLFESHWRLTPHLPVWEDYLLFGFFVVVGFLSLMRLQRHCALAGLRAVRAASAMVLGFGLIFIFFTFHAQSRNYLFPILTGVLDWNSLVPYLSLDLFFHPPFLGVWLFVYALSYYLLARSGRESWVLHLTAIFGAAYALVALRELAVARTELLVVSSLGVAFLMFGQRTEGKIRSVWLLAPLAWCLIFVAALFRFVPWEMGLSVTYLWLLLFASVVLFAGATMLADRRGFGVAWSQVVLFYFSAFFLLANRNYPGAPNFNNLICLGLELPRYFAGEMLIIGLLALWAAGCKTLMPRIGFWWLDLLSVALIALAFVDFRLTQIMGARLGWDVLAMGGNAKMVWRMSKPYLPGAIGGVLLLVGLYAVALRLAQSWLQRRSGTRTNGSEGKTVETVKICTDGLPTSLKRGVNDRGVRYAMGAFLLLGLIGLVTANADKAEGQSGLRLVVTSPIWKRAMTRTLKPEEFLRTARNLGIGDLNAGASAATTSTADLNVVLIFMESTYNNHLSLFGASEETQPLLSKYRERMELYPNFFSSFASSIHARFATFTSLYPVRDYNAFTLERVPVKSIFEVLHDNGYDCSLFYSSFLDYTGFRNFLERRGFNAVYDADTMPGERKTEPVAWGLCEEETLAAIQRQIKAYASGNQRFFLTYVPAAPHYPYEKVPERFHKYKPGDMGDYSPLYLNELLYMDWVLASIVEQLEESGLLDKTLIIITNDHGEMLGEHGGPIGHGFQLSPELVNTPLIIMDPRKTGYRVNHTIGSQIDLLPTTLDLLGIPVPGEELYEGRSLAKAVERGHLIYLNSMQEYGVIEENRLMLGDRERDRGALTRAVSIENSGSKTIFTETGTFPNPAVSIRQFDDFQENLLRNYSLYRDAMRRSPRFAAQR